jgi:glycosyltransferase involved in cell wall biosynthesis
MLAAPPRRILMLIPTLVMSGAENQLTYLARGLADLGHDVHVGYFDAGPNLARLENTRVRLHRVARSGNHDPLLLWRLWRLAREVKPDVVHTWLTMTHVLGGLAAIAARAPWVFGERSLPGGFGDDWKTLFERALARAFADVIVANSATADALWARRVPAPARRRVIPNALPLEALDAALPGDPRELGLRDDVPLVVYVGRMLAEKEIFTLLDALERAQQELAFSALLVGSGPLAAEVQRWIDAHGARGRIVAPGFRADAAAWLKRASVFISLSRLEGMPNTVIEAMALGVPIVVSELPQHREVLGDDSALFAPIGDAPAAAHAIVASLRDSAAAKARGARARERARAWSIERASGAYTALYEDVLAGSTRRAR